MSLHFTACNLNNDKKIESENSYQVKDPSTEINSLREDLCALMKNKVVLDTLLHKITHQEKVKIILELNETVDQDSKVYKYSDGNYLFKLKLFGQFNSSGQHNSIFFDGKAQISFKDFKLTC